MGAGGTAARCGTAAGTGLATIDAIGVAGIGAVTRGAAACAVGALDSSWIADQASRAGQSRPSNQERRSDQSGTCAQSGASAGACGAGAAGRGAAAGAGRRSGLRKKRTSGGITKGWWRDEDGAAASAHDASCRMAS
ncbi:hypothetical protein OCOJLMKI_1552 [Methylobacterium iners]|uniref:Uncharacterized protein n=1 Tax=Methylobacterium iners TaxID=418707 RepID=A0ABQ4RXV5_9HYPH|nr:hypothetical protein OCOJLMKI_1552 [Methylobacterium iners]